MGTHCTIGFETDTKEVIAIYCHYDGYPQFTGKLLVDHYNDKQLAHDIIALGDLSMLGERLNPLGAHTFEHPEYNTTIAYHRDRGEELRFEIYNNIEDFIANAPTKTGAEYIYIYRTDGWHCIDCYTNDEIYLYQYREHIM